MGRALSKTVEAMKKLTTLIALIALTGCESETRPAAATGRTREQLIDAYKKTHAAKDIDAMMKLVYWGEAANDDHSMKRNVFIADFDSEITSVTIEPLKADALLEYTREGVTWRPTLPPIGWLTITFEVGESGNAGTSVLVAEKDGSHHIVFAAPSR